VSRSDEPPARSAAPAGVRAARETAGPPVTASGYVTAQIRDGILSGAFPLGSRLDQQVLADDLGVSTIPVREALRHLEAVGLVRIHPRRGAFVAELSTHELDEIARIRVPLEELAIRMAATRLTEAQHGQLQDLIVQMSEAPTSRSWNDANRQWHLLLYSAAESPLLLELITMMWDRSILHHNLYAERPGSRETSNEDHRQMLARIDAGDGAGAARLIRKHIRRARNEVARRGATASDDDIQALRPA
jgi:DNA-binding GntR family transcriptional regulator